MLLVQRAEAMDVAPIGHPEARPAKWPEWRAIHRLRAFIEQDTPAGPIAYSPSLVALGGATELAALVVAGVMVRPPGDGVGVVIVGVAIWLMAFFTVRSVSGVHGILPPPPLR